VLFQPGTRIGPYEVLSSLGTGGMSEIFRARDTRLQREVAIKVVGPALAGDAEFLQRLEHEARLVGSLNHANIVAVYDVGMHEGAPYLVTELLQGETLRDRLAKGPVPLALTLRWAIEMADALAAAHDRGIVHRDLKPENVFITRAGPVKLLDFGIAKSSGPASDADAAVLEATLSRGHAATRTGMVLGTPGYMSPEQVQGWPVDARSDVFSFGTILYEMLSGERAFQGASVVDRAHAVLHTEPAPPPPSVPGPIANLVRRCLEKEPERRFRSAQDLSFALDAMRTPSGPTEAVPAVVARPRQTLGRGGAFIAALALATLAFFVGRILRAPSNVMPTIRELTFRKGTILAARFAPDGRTLYFNAAWGGGPAQIYTMSTDSPEVKPVGIDAAQLFSVSASGELAVSLHPAGGPWDEELGTLARVPALGGAPRELTTNVEYADWAPDGERLAVVRVVGGLSKLEFPIGHVLFETGGWISNPRVAPAGDRVAFIHHPEPGDSRGDVLVVGMAGKPETWAEGYDDLLGLAWRPDGKEVLFSGGRGENASELWIGRHAAAPQLLYRAPGNLMVADVARTGRALVIRRDWRREIELIHLPGGNATPVEWLDWPVISALSEDGKTVLWSESGDGVSAQETVFLRDLARPAPIRLGLGRALALSPDGKWGLTVRGDTVWLLPTGPGEARAVEGLALQRVGAAEFFKDGKRLALLGRTGRSSGLGLYVYDMELRELRRLSAEGVVSDEHGLRVAVSPDQKHVAVGGDDGVIRIYPVEGGEPRLAPEFGPATHVAGWLQDGSLLAFEGQTLPAVVRRVDLRTNAVTPWASLSPQDATGVSYIGTVNPSADGQTLALGFPRRNSELYLFAWGAP
jgi:eukaryotic-like serine/threonine-protein kinase